MCTIGYKGLMEVDGVRWCGMWEGGWSEKQKVGVNRTAGSPIPPPHSEYTLAVSTLPDIP